MKRFPAILILALLLAGTTGCGRRACDGTYTGSWGASVSGNADAKASTVTVLQMSGTTSVVLTTVQGGVEVAILGSRLLAVPRSEGSPALEIRKGQTLTLDVQGQGRMTFTVTGSEVLTTDRHIQVSLGANSTVGAFQLQWSFNGNSSP